MENTPSGSLEKLNKSLYSKKGAPDREISHHLSEKSHNVKNDWGEQADMPKQNIKSKSFWHKFFTFSVVFFIFAVALSSFIFWRGGNVISSENVDIVVNGPVGVSAGEEMSFQVSILNRNNVDLEGATLIVEYPSGTVNPANTEEPLPRVREEIGTIETGDKVQKVMKAVVYGEENEKKIVNIVVEYRVQGSNAIFFKEKPYEFIISSAPISLLVTGPENTSSGSEIELSVVLASNSEKPITNASVAINYPFGFSLRESEPESSSGNNFWQLGTLSPGEQKKITIRGVIEGQNAEERIFRVEAGTGERSRITTLFTSFLHSVAITKPALGIDVAISGNKNRTIAMMPGDVVRGDFQWQNNLQNQISDVSASMKITTSGFGVSDVSIPTGFYRSSDQTLIWTRDKNKSLALVNPGEKGLLSFGFKIPSLSELAGPSAIFENPNIRLNSHLSGNDLAVSGAGGNPSSTDERIIKISSPISLEATVFRKSENKHTVVLTVKNPLNELGGVKLTAILPSYVKWNNSFTPSSEAVSYNSFGGELLWNVGKMSAGVGYSKASRQLSIELELDGTLEDISSNSILLRDLKIIGDDLYTGAKVQFTIPQVRLNS